MLGTNIGIDLGTTSIVVFVEGKGIVMTEPCVAAYEKESGKLIGVDFKRLVNKVRIRKSVAKGIKR